MSKRGSLGNIEPYARCLPNTRTNPLHA